MQTSVLHLLLLLVRSIASNQQELGQLHNHQVSELLLLLADAKCQLRSLQQATTIRALASAPTRTVVGGSVSGLVGSSNGTTSRRG